MNHRGRPDPPSPTEYDDGGPFRAPQSDDRRPRPDLSRAEVRWMWEGGVADDDVDDVDGGSDGHHTPSSSS